MINSVLIIMITIILVAILFIKNPVLNLILYIIEIILFGILLMQMMWKHKKVIVPSLNEKVLSTIEPLSEPEFDIILENPGDNKIATTKCLRQIYNIGLHDAWLIIEHTPSLVKFAVSKQEAEYVTIRLTECGATVKIVKITI